jgi:alkylation response protein AidB-like acyl-CoA dehydrogenase
MTTIERPTATADLLAKVEQIRPIIEEHAEEGEANRRLAPPVYEALRDAGFLRLWVPKAFGGLEMHPAEGYRVFEALAAVDGAVAWNLNQHAAVSTMATWFRDALDELFADPDESFAGVFWPPGAATEVDGGFRVSATMKFASNSQFAKWFLVPAIVMENGAPRIDPATGGPDFVATIMPMSQGTISDTWHTMGMRATASNDVLVEDVFVPAHHAVRVFTMPATKPASVAGPLYGMVPWPGGGAHAAVPLGIARASVGKLVKLAETKIPNFYDTGLKARPVAQAQAAEALAAIDSASAYLAAASSAAYDKVAAGQALAIEDKCNLQQSITNAGASTLRAISLVHQAAGTSAMREEAGFEKLYRDASSIVQHAIVQTARFESVGRVMFGHEPDWFAFQL